MSDPALHEKASRDAATAAAHARYEQALEAAPGSDGPSSRELAGGDSELQELLTLEDAERRQRTDT
jgi:hypothetical protein